MDRAIGERLMERLLALTAPLNDAVALIEQIGDERQRLELRRGIGEVMGRVYTDLMVPIIREYPDLDPDK